MHYHSPGGWQHLEEPPPTARPAATNACCPTSTSRTTNISIARIRRSWNYCGPWLMPICKRPRPHRQTPPPAAARCLAIGWPSWPGPMANSPTLWMLSSKTARCAPPLTTKPPAPTSFCSRSMTKLARYCRTRAGSCWNLPNAPTGPPSLPPTRASLPMRSAHDQPPTFCPASCKNPPKAVLASKNSRTTACPRASPVQPRPHHRLRLRLLARFHQQRAAHRY